LGRPTGRSGRAISTYLDAFDQSYAETSGIVAFNPAMRPRKNPNKVFRLAVLLKPRFRLLPSTNLDRPGPGLAREGSGKEVTRRLPFGMLKDHLNFDKAEIERIPAEKLEVV
jgi:hypothetical protein